MSLLYELFTHHAIHLYDDMTGNMYVGNQLALARISRVCRIGTRAARMGRITRAYESRRQMIENNRSKQKLMEAKKDPKKEKIKRQDTTSCEAENNRQLETYVLVSAAHIVHASVRMSASASGDL